MPTHDWTTPPPPGDGDRSRPRPRPTRSQARVETESRRGGGSQETEEDYNPEEGGDVLNRRMSGWIVVIVVILIMAMLAGAQLNRQRQIEHVPITWAPHNICVPNGPVVDVTRFVDNPYVMTVHCAVDNITMTVATPAGH